MPTFFPDMDHPPLFMNTREHKDPETEGKCPSNDLDAAVLLFV
jgi:hypothetical protein